MTDDDILRMAREAGGTWEYRRTFPVACVMYDDELIKFANLVAARAAIEQAEKQKPVGWMWADGTITTDPDRADGTWTPLYTAPRQWQGLTKEDVDSWQLPERPTVFEFAQFVEAKLKEKNNA